MSFNPNFDDEDLPEFIKEFIKNLSSQFGAINPNEMTDIFKRMNSLDPEELEGMLKKMLGEEFFDKLSSIGDGIFGNSSGEFDPSKFDFSKINWSSLNKKSQEGTEKTIIPDKVKEEAYHEIIENPDGYEIIIDLPGITDPRQVNWEIVDEQLNLKAVSQDAEYYTSIQLPKNSSILNHLTKLNNSIFIIPFRRN